MDNRAKLTRCRFIALSIFLEAGGMCLLSRCTNPALSSWRFLTKQESMLIDALAEQIIPINWPGGRDASSWENYIIKCNIFYRKVNRFSFTCLKR